MLKRGKSLLIGCIRMISCMNHEEKKANKSEETKVSHTYRSSLEKNLAYRLWSGNFLGFFFLAPVRKVSLSTWYATRRRGDGGNTDRVEGEDLGCLWGRPSAVARWGFIPLVFLLVFLETPLGFCQCGEWIRKDVESQGWDLMMGLGLVDVDEFHLIWG